MKPEFVISPDASVLVTGSSGFIGARVVQILLEYGFSDIHCFVRASSRLDRLKDVLSEFDLGGHVKVVTGDLLSRKDCDKAAEGVSLIYHLAAGIDKSFAGAFMNSALATRNLMDAFIENGRPKRFVSVSSFAVYSNLALNRGDLLDESCPLETAPQERFDAYGFGKLKQEELVREYGERRRLPYVIVRPGAVFGPGKPALSGRVGINTFGFFVHLGHSNRLPLSYVDNCAEAIVLAGLTPAVDGETFNIVDDDLPTSGQFLRAYKKRTGPFFSLPMPYFAAKAGCLLWEKYSRWSQGQLPPVFNRRRCAAEWKGNRYSNQKLKNLIGWKPRVPMDQAMARFFGQFGQDTR
jgi:nucleoside-diphosphate-sugar epimerase